jgi:hypothetical protein
MQNARVIQLGSSGVKVTRNSASFDEAFGGYSNKKKNKFSNATGDFMLPLAMGTTSSTSNTANLPVVTDAPRDYSLMSIFGTTTTTLQKVGGGSKSFPNNTPFKMVRSYKVLNGNPIEVKLSLVENGITYTVVPTTTKDVATNLQAHLLPINPTTTGTTTTGTTTTTTTNTLADLLPTLTLEKITRFTTDNPLMPSFQGFYKVVNDVNGVRDNGLSKKFLKDTIVEGYLQTFNNPTTGGKSAYWVVQSEVPTTVGNINTITQAPSSVVSNIPVSSVAPSMASSGTSTSTTGTVGTTATTSTQTSPKPNTTAQTKSSATGTTMASFKLPLYALVPAQIGGTTVSLDPNQGGGTNTGGGNQDPNQGVGGNTGGGSGSADLDALNAQIESQYGSQPSQNNANTLEELNAQIEAQQLAQMQQEGESGVNLRNNTFYTPSEEELMTDIDTNYAPDTEIESSFDGYGNSNAMETMIKNLCKKIAWNKEMAEMLKRKKGVDKSELKAEYVAKVDRVNELLRELKGYETPANREYIKKMLNHCDMMRPSMKKTMKKDIVIQNANPKIIDLGNVNPTEFKDDLGNTLMKDETSSFMGNVINYSDFSGSATSTALIGVGIGAVLGIIGIVVIKKMKK